jgi:hypothetical protein
MAFLLAKPTPLNVNHGNDRFSMFNKKRDIAQLVVTGAIAIAPVIGTTGRTWQHARAIRNLVILQGHGHAKIPAGNRKPQNHENHATMRDNAQR